MTTLMVLGMATAAIGVGGRLALRAAQRLKTNPPNINVTMPKLPVRASSCRVILPSLFFFFFFFSFFFFLSSSSLCVSRACRGLTLRTMSVAASRRR
jgi:hypothetical protein